jgi:hypothetical protein
MQLTRSAFNLIVLAAVLLTGCSGKAAPAEVNATPATPVAATPVQDTQAPAQTPYDTPSEDELRHAIIQAFSKLTVDYPYTLTEVTSTGSSTLDRTTEFAAAEHTHSTWMLSTGGEGESIHIGHAFYWKLNGQWSKTGPPPGTSPDRIDFGALLIPGMRSVQYAGREWFSTLTVGRPQAGPTPVAGYWVDHKTLQCDVIKYTLKTTLGNLNVDGAGEVWIGPGVRLCKATFSGILAGLPTEMELVYQFDLPIHIQSPIP